MTLREKESSKKMRLWPPAKMRYLGISNVLFLAALLTALFLYSFHLSSDLYGDERGHTYTVVATGDFWANIQDPSMCHPPLYFMLAKLSYNLIGKPWGIRIPSIVFALGTVIILPLVAKRILGEHFFLPTAWMSALSPFLLEFAAEGRAYAMLIFFSVAMTWALFEFLQGENAKNMLTLIVIAICGALTHYFFWLQLIFAASYYLTVRRHVSRYGFGVLAIVLMVLAPLGSSLFGTQEENFTKYLQVSWSETFFSVPNFIARLPVALTYGFSTFDLPNLDPARNFSFQVLFDNWFLSLLVLISFVGIIYACVRLALEKKKWFWLLFLGVVIPSLLGLVGGTLGFYLIREKHLAVVWGSYSMLLLLALHYLSRTKGGFLVMGCYAVVVIVSIVHFIAYPNEYSRRMDWTGLNRALEGKINHSDSILFYASDPQSLSLGKMKVLDDNFRIVNLEVDRPKGISLEEFVEQIDKSTEGKIFLINNETDRHMVDPNSEVIKTFMSTRMVSESRFGRNLILYEFKRNLHK
jgi:hypothetical protein